MKKINAVIVADSKDDKGNRITSLLLTFPRFILAELNTHRMFTRSSASSRAIPFAKMVQMVKDDPFIPYAWQKDHKGMQGNVYFNTPEEIQRNIEEWHIAKEEALNSAMALNRLDVTKQLCNRLLEPFMWHTVLVTATEFENFFKLRCPKYILTDGEICNSKKDAISFSNGSEDTEFYNKVKDYDNIAWLKESTSGAEIHMQALAEAMWDAMNESTPAQLKPGEWHIPFGDKINLLAAEQAVKEMFSYEKTEFRLGAMRDAVAVKIATARCARTSYNNFDGSDDYCKDMILHDTLLKSGHMSPFEHCAKTMTDKEYHQFYKGFIQEDESYNNKDNYGWCNNFRGFIPYRYIIENKQL